MDAVNTNPLSFRLASAYGVTPKAGVNAAGKVAGSVAGSASPTSSNAAGAIMSTRTDRVDETLARIRPLVGAMVPGSIDFSASVPQQSSGLGGGLAMYRHPYDKNAAATGVESGKAIDVTG